MTAGDFNAPYEPPRPVPGGPWFPYVLRQVQTDHGDYLVTFALPGLTTATVRVPERSWLDGEHLALPGLLAARQRPEDGAGGP